MKSARPASAQPQKGSSPGIGRNVWKGRGRNRFRLLSKQIDYLPDEVAPYAKLSLNLADQSRQTPLWPRMEKFPVGRQTGNYPVVDVTSPLRCDFALARSSDAAKLHPRLGLAEAWVLPEGSSSDSRRRLHQGANLRVNPMHRDTDRSAGLHLFQELSTSGQHLAHPLFFGEDLGRKEPVLPASRSRPCQPFGRGPVLAPPCIRHRKIWLRAGWRAPC